jgi:ADP-heptose:LPS heptosyltransferase
MKRIIDVHCASRVAPHHGLGIGDAILMLPVVAGIQAANPHAHVRIVVKQDRVEWANLGWPHTVTYENVVLGQRLHNEVWPQRWESLGGDKFAVDACITRMQLWAHEACVSPVLCKPIIPPDARAWAKESIDRYFGGAKVVWLSPWACGRERNWPQRRWAELIDALLCCGYTLAGVRTKGGDFIDGVTWFEAESFPADRTAAMFEQAALVIGNDSGMVHVAGFVGTPALAVCGPTDGKCVFGSYPSVRIVQAGKFCTACLGISRYYNPRWCRLSCDALQELQAPDVIKVALEMLKK